MHSTASNAVGFAANFFARVWPLLNKEPSFRTAVGALLVFAVDIDDVVDRDFQLAAQKASDAGQTETLDFFTRWLGVMIPERSGRALTHPGALPALPKVVFYDVACKIDRNGMQRLSLMKLTAAFKLTDAAAKPENDGVRLNEY
ncbi:hypothetical protein I4F81_009465 [Pyropia yezoensis]|uniref:Uncharacterized protein n=1 Tax=Pyropia yezoensis TaxID=2788 RepID=A0ACC3CAR1_PYRYE|nr:hypothetical protein I4F81_009465 [Neopyropia yezoensis]